MIQRRPSLFGLERMWFSFLVIAVGVFMSTLDSSMVNIILPAIMEDFQSTLRATEWVVMIYLLTITATLLFWGYLSDRLGRRRIYAAGLLSFALGSLACAQAGALEWLVAFRLLQALGAAMMMATGPAMVKEIFPAHQLGRGLGLIGIAVSLGLMAGPAFGGLLLELYSWRAVFLITVPVGFLFAALASWLLPAESRVSHRPFDLAGAALWTGGLCLLSLGISQASAPGASSALGLGLAAGGLLLVFLLVKVELAVPSPFLPIQFFGQRFFSIGVLSAILSFVILFAALILMPFYLDHILGLSGTALGLVMMAIPLAVLLVAPVAGWLADHIGARLLTTGGLLLSSTGLFLLAQLTPEQQPWEVAWRLALLGGGQAMFLSPNSASVLGRMGTPHVGASAALLATARNLGMLLGIAAAGLMFSSFFGAYSGGLDLRDFSPLHQGAFMRALRHSFLITTGIGLAGALTSWRRGAGHWRPAGSSGVEK